MTIQVRARVDEDIKSSAEAVLENIGLTVSDVMKVVLTRIAREKAVPPGLFVPTAETVEAMKEGREILRSGKFRFKTAQEMFDALENAVKEDEAKSSAEG